MKCFDFKKKKKGSAAAEASIAFPVVLILVISIVFYVVKISSREIDCKVYDLTSKIRVSDSIERKAEMVFETLFE
ncbi:MAG: hypothetical protein KA982_05865 [Clostridia bacterium]|jgi:uncharacterized protein (UPF0333 family)|nr:hypothetical protein [Clostridia bacterium]MDD4501968.1 hypothetical protein [Clostridia bacterium]HQO68926.1 hypothetical protein [Clostridia bacterium]